MDPLLESLQHGLGDAVRLERELGGGGMSRVFVARDTSLDRPVVVKLLSAEASEGISADRFRREIQLIAKLRHPLIVPILSASDVGGLLYYTMPLIAGDSLRARLALGGALSVPDAVRVIRDVLDALGFAHANGVVHRDIKPENILLEAGHSLIADFGVAKALGDSARMTSTGISIGTPAYMAPEQVAGSADLDHRADLYAVGVVAYEMLAGAPPFVGTAAQVVTSHLTRDAQPIAQRRPDLPPALAELIMRALEKDPERRPSTAAEMIAVIDAMAPAEASAPRKSMLKRARLPLAAAAGIALMIAGAWRLARPAVVGSAQSIAIVPLSVTDGDTALVRLSQNLVTLLSNNLAGVGDIRVADPISVLSHARSLGHLVGGPDAMRIARALNVRSAVSGTLVRNGAVVRVDVGLYDVRSPESPIARVSVSAPADSVELLTDSLTIGLLKQVWSNGSAPTPRVTSVTTRSPVALRDFLDGERRFMHGDIYEAGNAYRRAAERDTTFWFAAYRYATVRAWQNAPVENRSILERLNRHRADLPERERALLATGDSSPMQSEQLRRLAIVAARYPDYAPAWEQLADRLVHFSGQTGRKVDDAIEAWRHVAALMPSDLTTADHLVYACTAAGDLACARGALVRFDSLIRADPAAATQEVMEQRVLTLALVPLTRSRRDSIISVAMRDSGIVGLAPNLIADLAPALIENPEFLSHMEAVSRRVMSLPAADAMVRRTFQAGEFLARAMRGDWSSLDSADGTFRAGIVLPGVPYLPTETARARVLAELQGALAPSARTSEILASQIGNLQLAPADRVELRWEAAVNSLLRGDSGAVRVQLASLDKDTTSEARIAARSIHALELGLGGKRAIAAESLLVLERQHGEYAPKVPGAMAADRLLAAEWLTELGKPAAADSLLEFTRGYLVRYSLRAAWPVFAAAQLQRSRIAEALGKREDAIFYATLFTRVYDLAPAEHKAQMDEATQRIERLGGNRDARKPQSIPR
jgi:TolB-like protein